MEPKLAFHGWPKFWWVTMNIVTLGIPYFRKLMLEKALMDVWNMQASLAHQARVAEMMQAQPPAQQPGLGYMP
jgi:hypothetical protein